LRPEIGVGESSLYDSLFHRHVQLGPLEIAAARRLPEISDETAIRRFLHLNLIDGAGADVIDRARRLKAGNQKLPRVILGEARFQCAGSGECCQSYNYGPLSDADIARIEPLAKALVDGEWWYQRDGRRYLTMNSSRCCFLLDDCRCGLHARFGAEAKPDLCRFYPYEQLATLWGIQYYDKGQCSEFAKTARSGPPLAEWIDELTAVMGDPEGLYHPAVLLRPLAAVDYGYFQPLLSAMIDDLERPPAQALEMLRAWARRTRALAAELAVCALSPEGPTLATEALVARGVEPFLFVGEGLQPGAQALAEVARQLAEVVMLPLTEEDNYSGHQSRELIPVLQLLIEIASHIAGEGPLSDYAREAAAVSADDADCDDVLRLSLRNQLFGRDALLSGRVEAAQLRLALVQLLALWGARLRALGDGRKRIDSGDLTRCHMLALRVTSRVAARKLLVALDGCSAPLVEVLPQLGHFRP
jgi:hypothetical protein